MEKVIEKQPSGHGHVPTTSEVHLKELEKIDTFHIKKKSGSSTRLAMDGQNQELFSYGQKVLYSGVPQGDEAGRHIHLATMGIYDKAGVELIATDLRGNIRSGDIYLGKIQWAENSCPCMEMIKITVTNCPENVGDVVMQPQGDGGGGCCLTSGLSSSMVKYDILVGGQTVGTMAEPGNGRRPKVEFPMTLSSPIKGIIAVLSFKIYDSFW